MTASLADGRLLVPKFKSRNSRILTKRLSSDIGGLFDAGERVNKLFETRAGDRLNCSFLLRKFVAEIAGMKTIKIGSHMGGTGKATFRAAIVGMKTAKTKRTRRSKVISLDPFNLSGKGDKPPVARPAQVRRKNAKQVRDEAAQLGQALIRETTKARRATESINALSAEQPYSVGIIVGGLLKDGLPIERALSSTLTLAEFVKRGGPAAQLTVDSIIRAERPKRFARRSPRDGPL